MSKRNSDVNLDLGNLEEEEESDEEEEEEEEEDDKVEKEKIASPKNDIPKLEESLKEKEQKDEKNNENDEESLQENVIPLSSEENKNNRKSPEEKINLLSSDNNSNVNRKIIENNENKKQIRKIRKIISKGKLDKIFNKSVKKRKNMSIEMTLKTMVKKPDNIKSVFTKISENFVNSKNKNYSASKYEPNKTSFYEIFIDDKLLSREYDRLTGDRTAYENFEKRNIELRHKKEEKLKKKKKEHEKVLKASMFQFRTHKEVRSLDEYVSDISKKQQEIVNNKKMNSERVQSNIMKTMQVKPIIDKKSEKIFMSLKSQKENFRQPAHERLFNVEYNAWKRLNNEYNSSVPPKFKNNQTENSSKIKSLITTTKINLAESSTRLASTKIKKVSDKIIKDLEEQQKTIYTQTPFTSTKLDTSEKIMLERLKIDFINEIKATFTEEKCVLLNKSTLAKLLKKLGFIVEDKKEKKQINAFYNLLITYPIIKIKTIENSTMLKIFETKEVDNLTNNRENNDKESEIADKSQNENNRLINKLDSESNLNQLNFNDFITKSQDKREVNNEQNVSNSESSNSKNLKNNILNKGIKPNKRSSQGNSRNYNMGIQGKVNKNSQSEYITQNTDAKNLDILTDDTIQDLEFFNPNTLFTYLAIILNIHKYDPVFSKTLLEVENELINSNIEIISNSLNLMRKENEETYLNEYSNKKTIIKVHDKLQKDFYSFKHSRVQFILEEKRVKKYNKIINETEQAFTLKTNFISQTLTNSNGKTRNDIISNNLKKQQNKKKFIIDEILKEKEKKELAECTFQPNFQKLNDRFAIENNSTFNKLYEDNLARKLRINGLKEQQEQQEKDKIKSSCTFKPTINKKEICLFNKGSEVLDNSLVKAIVKRYEKARIQKKVNEIQKNKGYTSLSNINNLEDLLQEKPISTWSCATEVKTYKNTLDIHQESSKISSSKGFNPYSSTMSKTAKKNPKQVKLSEVVDSSKSNDNHPSSSDNNTWIVSDLDKISGK
jgi:hypothetical protein